jgi:hypothetical protein
MAAEAVLVLAEREVEAARAAERVAAEDAATTRGRLEETQRTVTALRADAAAAVAEAASHVTAAADAAELRTRLEESQRRADEAEVAAREAGEVHRAVNLESQTLDASPQTQNSKP